MSKFADVIAIKNGRNQKKVENPNGKYPIYGSGGIMGYADDYLCNANTVIIGRKGNINKPIYVEEPLWNVDTAFGLEANPSILLPKYLYYFCEQYDFERLNTTVTIPSLTKANLLQIDIPVPALQEQEYIVSLLDQSLSLIRLRKQQIETLDLLVKSKFVEMFGDLYRNDKGWPKENISVVCSEIVDCVNKTAPSVDYQTPYKMLRTTNVKKGVVNTADVRYVDLDTYKKWTRRSRPRSGDVLLTREAPIGEVGIVNSNDNLFLGQRLVSYRCNEDVMNPNFLLYQFMTPFLILQIDQLGKGSTVKHLPVPDCNKFTVYVPPLPLQNDFAQFVEKVEQQKSLMQQHLDLLETNYKALMQTYFG